MKIQIKPGNILINENVKLTDFGIAHIKEFNEKIHLQDLEETFGYMSPEQIGIIKVSADERSDLYSVGMIFYKMLTGRLPFEGKDVSTIIKQRISRTPEPPSFINSVLSIFFSVLL